MPACAAAHRTPVSRTAPRCVPLQRVRMNRVAPCVKRRGWYLAGARVALRVTPRAAAPVIAQRLEGEVLTRSVRVAWRVDDESVGDGAGANANWALEPGAHQVTARVRFRPDGKLFQPGSVAFSVVGPEPLN